MDQFEIDRKYDAGELAYEHKHNIKPPAEEPEGPVEHPSFTRAKALPEPLRSHFPKSVEEAKEFQPRIRRRALASTVLVVAKTRVECAWACYCDSVPGQNHDNEEAEVLRHGDKLDEGLARVLFPEFEKVPYAR